MRARRLIIPGTAFSAHLAPQAVVAQVCRQAECNVVHTLTVPLTKEEDGDSDPPDTPTPAPRRPRQLQPFPIADEGIGRRGPSAPARHEMSRAGEGARMVVDDAQITVGAYSDVSQKCSSTNDVGGQRKRHNKTRHPLMCSPFYRPETYVCNSFDRDSLLTGDVIDRSNEHIRAAWTP